MAYLWPLLLIKIHLLITINLFYKNIKNLFFRNITCHKFNHTLKYTIIIPII